MGQSSIPTLNRSGYSMFWTSVWDTKHNYTSFFKEDVLIRKYINFIFNEKASAQIFRTYKDFYFNDSTQIVKMYNIKFDMSNYSVSILLQRFNKLPVYISKIHIIRLDNWIVIYFVGSTPTNLNKNELAVNTEFFNKHVFFKKNILNQFRQNIFF